MSKNYANSLNYSFDRNLEYETINKNLTQDLKSLFKEIKISNSLSKVKAMSNIIISLIQLRNGARISEIIEALEIFMSDLSTKTAIINIAKRKDYARREILLPKEVKKEMLEYLINFKVIDFDHKLKIQNKVRNYLNKYYDSNTHSLRYATINKLVEEEVPLNIVSKLVGHKNLNQIMSYTQNKKVKNVLEQLQNNKK